MKPLQILKTDMKTFIRYQLDRMTAQVKAGDIDSANLTLETVKTCKSWLSDLSKFICLDENQLANDLELQSHDLEKAY